MCLVLPRYGRAGKCNVWQLTSQLSVGSPGSSMISVAKAVAINFVAEMITVLCF